MLEINKIYNVDCLEGLRLIDNNSIDLILTSPPYNFNINYNDYKDKKSWSRYFNWLKVVWEECYRVLKNSGRLVINIQPLFSDHMPSHHIISNQCLQLGFLWKGEILWEKNNYNCKYTAWGSWKSPASPYLKYTWEFIEIFCKENFVKRGEKNKIDISADEFKQWVVAKWSIAPEKRMKKFGHPAMFPEQLVERILKLFSYKDDIILDPFNGVGTTTTVAYKFGRKFICHVK